MTPDKTESREQRAEGKEPKADGKEQSPEFGANGGIQPGRYYGHGLPYAPIEHYPGKIIAVEGTDGVGRSTHESGISLAVFGRDGVMAARALVAQGAVDDDEVRGRSAATICPADVTLSSKRHPLANNSSAIRTANGAPTAQPTIPAGLPASVEASSWV